MQDYEGNIFGQKQDRLETKYPLKLETCLEILHSSHDIHVLSKIFSSLGIQLLSTETCIDRIIKCDILYEKIVLVLNSTFQEKTTIALHLLSALLSINENGKTRNKCLLIYAQNMIRISGCLTAMTYLFVCYMMHQDTMKALCRSISEACHNVPKNQSYCSHIIPLCVQRCRSGNTDVFIVLENLLSNHSDNVWSFYKSNGMSVFTRESLQHPICLQLLNTLVENTPTDYYYILSQSPQLFGHLRHFLYRYGATNVLGQWASIILFSYRKVQSHTEVTNLSKVKDKTSDRTINKEKFTLSYEHNETRKLFQNVLKEVIGFHNAQKNIPNINNHNRTNLPTSNHRPARQYFSLRPSFEDKYNINDSIKYIRRKNKTILNNPTISNKDLSFSFLLKTNLTQNDSKNLKSNIKMYNENPSREYSQFKNNIAIPVYHTEGTLNRDTSLSKTAYTTFSLNNDINDTIHFVPKFNSTPKNRFALHVPSQSVQLSKNRTVKRLRHFQTKNEKKNVTLDYKLQNKTLSSKLLDVINGSCTTLAKSFASFRNIFSSKAKENSINRSPIVDAKVASKKNSFTVYMNKRDAFYNCSKSNGSLLSRNFISEANNFSSCNTCNDTIALKQKLLNDEKLQQTLKRLKFGINLYGCDFKKISRTMWSHEEYMTPSVLYNLYRKLIIK